MHLPASIGVYPCHIAARVDSDNSGGYSARVVDLSEAESPVGGGGGSERNCRSDQNRGNRVIKPCPAQCGNRVLKHFSLLWGFDRQWEYLPAVVVEFVGSTLRQPRSAISFLPSPRSRQLDPDSPKPLWCDSNTSNNGKRF